MKSQSACPALTLCECCGQAYTAALNRQFGSGIGYGGAFLPLGEQLPCGVSAGDAETGLRLSAPLLERAAAVCRSGQGEEAVRRRQKLIREWDEWRAEYPVTVRPSFEGSHPWDVLAFLEHWRARHSGRRARAAGPEGAGSTAMSEVAPGTLRAVAGQLSRLFEGVGRDGAWSPGQSRGNPAAHALVRLYLKGYDSHAFQELGYSSSGAVPVDAGQHGALVRHLLARAASGCSGYDKAMYLRDASAFAYLWETGQRGKECCQLKIRDFCYDDKLCSDAWADLAAGTTAPGRRLLVECSAGTKTRRTRHPGTLELAPRLEGHAGCALREILPAYASAMEACQSRLTRWLFPPSNAGHDGFDSDRAMSSGALNRRLRTHLQQLGDWHGESLHGIRRGSTQHAYAEGEQDIGALARKRLWAQTESLEAYLHVTRHKQRLTEAGGSKAKGLEEEATAPGKPRCAKTGALFGWRGSRGSLA